jgi:photosystem II stability/assembly factor-like uncharacterized protein
MHMKRAIRGLLAQAMLCGGLAVLSAGVSYAQWTQTSGPKGGSIRSLLTVPNGSGGTSLYAGQVYVWRTDDNGASWTRGSSGLTDPNAFALVGVPNGSGGNDIFVGTGNGVFRSTNNGASWSSSSNGIPPNLSIYALTSGSNGSGGTNLYAGAFLGSAFRSTDNGASWTAINSGLPSGQANVNALTTTASGTVLAGTMNGIYRSTNFGASWTRVFNFYGFSFAKHGSTIYAGTSSGVWRSTNDGASWTAINNGMGFTWTYAVAAIPNGSGVTLFASAGGVMRSTDNGATWTPVNNGLPNIGVYALATAPNAAGGTDLYAGTTEGVFRTSNNGSNWTDISFIVSYVQGLEVTPSGAILAGTERDIFRSTDGGASWTDTQVNASILDFAVNLNGTSGVSLFACDANSGIYKSTNDGATWFGSSNDIDDVEVNSLAAVPNGSGGSNLIAGTYSGISISTNDGGNWQKVEPNAMPLDYVMTPNGSGGHNIFGGGFGGVWLSTNGGVTWVNTGLSGTPQGMAATGNGANVFAGGDPFGVYRSTNNGATWTLVNSGLTDLRIMALLSPDGTNLFAAGGGGVFLSTDNGNSWTSVSQGLTTGVFSLAVSRDGSTLLAGSTGLGVWKRPLSEMINVAPPPPSPPSIASFTPTSGPVGTEVTITGSNLLGASSVKFNGTAASAYTVLSGTQIRATVASGSTTGRITVTTSAGTATSSGDFTVTIPPAQTTLTFFPPHDAWVRSSSPSSNFGSRAELAVRGGNQTTRSYLKFTVSGVTGTIQSATLRLRVVDAGPDGGSVFSVSNNFAGTSTPWTESGLTWTNAPALGGAALDAGGPVTVNTWIDLDVTSAITGNGTYSLALSGSSNNLVEYSSSEGANSPRLILVAVSGGAAATMREPSEPSMAAAQVPRDPALHANYPNPFNPSTTIHYSLPRAMVVRLVIYDVTGRLVRRLVDDLREAGEQRAVWDGTDQRGRTVGSGMYVYRLEAGGTTVTRKMSLLK